MCQPVLLSLVLSAEKVAVKSEFLGYTPPGGGVVSISSSFFVWKRPYFLRL